MKKKVLGIVLVLFVLGAGSAFAITLGQLMQNLGQGVRESEGVVNASRNWSTAEQAQDGWDRLAAQINRAESAVQDAKRWEAIEGEPLPANQQRQVNIILANLRQIRDKMRAFGIRTDWAIDL